MGSNTAGPGSERGPRVAWQGHTHTPPLSPPRGASYTQPSPAAGDTLFRIRGGDLLYPICEASSACGETEKHGQWRRKNHHTQQSVGSQYLYSNRYRPPQLPTSPLSLHSSASLPPLTLWIRSSFPFSSLPSWW